MAKIENREKKKEKLRRRVLKFDESDFKRPKRTLLIKHKKEKKIIISILMIVIMVILLLFLFIRKYSHFFTVYIRTFASTKSIFNADCRYTKFNNGIIRYSRDGVSFIKDNGNMVWVDSYDIDNPIISKSKDYVGIASKGGKDIHIYDIRGFVSSFESESIIDDLSISDDGDMAILTHDNNAKYIYIYEKSGRYGDIYIKYIRQEDGEIGDISFSPDGNLLMVSTYILDDTNIKSKILFYNMDVKYEGENADRLYKGDPRLERLVKTYDGYNDKIFNKLHFFDNKNAISLSNGEIVFYNINKKTGEIDITKDIIIDEIINSISMEDGYLSLILGDEEYAELEIYDRSGKLHTSKKIDFDYLSFYTVGGLTYFMGIDELIIIDKKGVEKYKGKLYDDMIYVKKKFGLFFYDVIVGCVGGVKRAILY